MSLSESNEFLNYDLTISHTMHSSLQGFALIGSLFTAVAASSLAIRSDNEGLKCTSRDDCVQWYKTGLLGCRGGYQGTAYRSVDGEAKGTYCERKCNDAEWETCRASDCAFNLRECRLYPGNHICTKALRYCGSPIVIPERSCTKEATEEFVLFDKATGRCSIDPNPGARAERHMVVDLFSSVYYGWLKNQWISIDCGPTTEKGAEEVWAQISREAESSIYQPKLPIRSCQGKIDYKQAEPRARCVGPIPSDGMIVRIAAQACEKAKPVNGKQPVLSINRKFEK